MSIRTKALAYLRDGNVIVRSAVPADHGRAPFQVRADVIGQNSTYLVQLTTCDGWTCTCKNDGCAHVAAVQLVTGHKSAAAK